MNTKLNDIVAAKILTIIPHPHAAKLKICTVNTGTENLQIVCGAANARSGMMTVLAKIGSTTPHGMFIKESDLRGVISQGMLCSPLELKVSQEQGIVDLPPSIKEGTPLDQLKPEYLSSTPWYSYQLIEQFFWDEQQKKIYKKSLHHAKLVSETYLIDGTYKHRHYHS